MSGNTTMPDPAADEARSFTISDLPDSLLQRIMAAAGQASRPCLLLVSKLWQRCCCNEPALWTPYRIPWCPCRRDPGDAQQQWLDANISLLQRATVPVTDLVIHAGHPRSYPCLPRACVAALATAALNSLAQQRPPVLEAVRIEWIDEQPDVSMLKALACVSAGLTRLDLRSGQLLPKVAGALGALTSLRTLKLIAYRYSSSVGKLPPNLLSVLHRQRASLENLEISHLLDETGAASLANLLPLLQQLHRLACRPLTTQALLASIAGLAGLTALDLRFTVQPDQPAPDLQLLTRLQSLLTLQLVRCSGGEEEEGACWPAPSHFPHLRSFYLYSSGFRLAGSDCKMDWCFFDCGQDSSSRNLDPAAARRLVLRPRGSPPEQALGQLLDALTASLPSGALEQLQWDGLLQCTGQVSAATSVRLQGSGMAALPAVALPRLQTLAVEQPLGEDAASLLLQAARLPALAQLRYSGINIEAGGYLRIDASVLPRLVELGPECESFWSSNYPVWRGVAIADSALPALQQLTLSTKRLCLSGVLLPALTALHLTSDTSFRPFYSDTDGALRIASSQLPALQAINANGFSTLRLLCTLPALSSLELSAVNEACTVQAAEGALPALRSVMLGGKGWYHTPRPLAALAWLASLPTLTNVVLKHMDLSDGLPEGPWLDGLEGLEIFQCNLARLPPALRHATRLTTLSVSDCGSVKFQLHQEDIDSILRPLTQLRQLDVPWLHCCDPPLFIYLFSTLRNLSLPADWPPKERRY